METYTTGQYAKVLVGSLVIFGTYYLIQSLFIFKGQQSVPHPIAKFMISTRKLTSNTRQQFQQKQVRKTNEANVTCFSTVASNHSDSYGCIPNDAALFDDVKFVKASSILHFLGIDQFRSCDHHEKSTLPQVPVIVSAASSDHYAELAYFCKNLNESLRIKFPNLTFIVYDLEISETPDSHKLQQFCGCQMRKFPFFAFPDHVKNLRGYTWKPLVIALMLREFPFVMWVDASIRFNSKKDITKLWDKTRYCHIQQISTPGFTVGDQTDTRTMDFLNQNGYDFLNVKGLAAGWGVYIRSEFMIQRVLRPWILCAVSYGCMLSDSTRYGQGPCIHKTPRKPGICHRFEQAVLGVILGKLYRNESSKYLFAELDFGFVRRGQTLNFRKQIQKQASL